MELTSARNPLLQKIRRAAAAGRPTEDGLVVAEGPHLLAEANRGLWTIERIFATAQARTRHHALLAQSAAEIVEVSERALTAASATESPQHILALLRPRTWAWSDLERGPTLLVVLDRIQDPGNLGNIVRSAEAFGATGLIFLTGCARITNGKALRAAAGSLFRMPFLEEVSRSGFIERSRSGATRLYALDAQAETPLGSADLRLPCALLAGSEGAGLHPELLAAAQGVSIPAAAVESLNAAVACSIALYEASRQRRPA